MTSPVYACTVAYTGQVTFDKVKEKHGHVLEVVKHRVATDTDVAGYPANSSAAKL